ncbi:MAG TPA: MBL fold metallo-hydrolase [Gaiellaceae bacterium]|nr:MBL fold metallo-hydrolase [Gaiellaceae bacterium]
MLVEKSMHPEWLSNAFLVAIDGGPAVFIDSGADPAPLIEAAERWRAKPVALLRTHSHGDHVVHEEELAARYSIPVIAEPGEWEWDGLKVRGLATPGHSDDGLSFVIGDDLVATGDTLFLDAVGGGDVETVRRSVMDLLMALPDETRVLPGHTEETTIGRERRENPFVRVWSGAEDEGTEKVRVGGRDATLVVWSPDYDGKGKAWVRYDDGTEATVGGSRVERG